MRLAAFILYNKGNYEMPIPEYLSSLIYDFKALDTPSQAPPALVKDSWYFYARKLVEILMYVWTRIWDPLIENSIGDPTMCLLALSSIKANSGWASAVELTPVIARLFFCMRAIFLYHLYMEYDELDAIWEQHMDLQKWLQEGSYSTFNSLCSLQALASMIAYATPMLPAFIWYDPDKTEFIWWGWLITITAFWNMGQELMQGVYKWFAKVMMGIKIQIAGYVADNLTNNSPGYGFMSDSRNKKIYNRRTFFNIIMADKTLRKEFVLGVSADGAPVLNLGRLHQWLCDYSNALLYLMAAIEVLGGSPS